MDEHVFMCLTREFHPLWPSVCDTDGGGGVGRLSESSGRHAGEERCPAGAAVTAAPAAAAAGDAAARLAAVLHSAEDAGELLNAAWKIS